eukprot:CAMPEP_0117521348 /NCGR_PEP_ID=MMETSP0784-20121206/33639_1 /TAXON_ID=39447 /ORGANISM="" /LENGTH=428 /DNA_ID=CAMNT_0005317373 /DNA_START=213 /DNA_END=1499 /DNA_ORIENTATION=-
MQDLAIVAQDREVGELYKPENIIGNDEGSANCYAKAFHTEGPDLADRCLEVVRKEFERCHCPQGLQFCHSVGGGTGSGLTGLLMKTLYDYLGKQGKCIMQSFALVPAPGVSDMVTEHYNAALGLQDLLEYTDQVFFFDNTALTEICQKTLEKDTPTPFQLNNLIAQNMSGITSCLRFSGPLNSDMRKMQTNLVPFKNAHFLINAMAPLTANDSKRYRSFSVQDLAQQMISKDNVTVKCDPLNPGDPREGILKARFIASFALWRGTVRSSDTDDIVHALQKPGSRYDSYFPDWIPNAIAGNICDVTHPDNGKGVPSVTFVSNNTAVHEVFDRIIATWDRFYEKKAFVHVYQHEGLSAQDMMESRNMLQYVSDQYCEIAGREDKLLQDTGGRLVTRDSAIRTDEQRLLAQELKELGDGRMFITQVDRHRR